MQLLADLFMLVGGFGVFGLIIGILASIFWLWMLIDAVINPALNGTEKIVWVLVVLFLHVLGAILYFLLARGKGAGTPAL